MPTRKADMISTTKTHDIPEFAEFPKTFRELCMSVYLPKPIHSRIELREAGRILSVLSGNKMTRDQREYFEAVGEYVEEYESKYLPHPAPISPLTLLRDMMEDHEMTQSDLGRIIDASESTMSKILSGDRKLKIEEAKAFAFHFKLRVEAFA